MNLEKYERMRISQNRSIPWGCYDVNIGHLVVLVVVSEARPVSWPGPAHLSDTFPSQQLDCLSTSDLSHTTQGNITNRSDFHIQHRAILQIDISVKVGHQMGTGVLLSLTRVLYWIWYDFNVSKRYLWWKGSSSLTQNIHSWMSVNINRSKLN